MLVATALVGLAWPAAAGAVRPGSVHGRPPSPLETTTTTTTTSTTVAGGARGGSVTTSGAAPSALAFVAVPAGATKVARRLRQLGSLVFPMEPLPKCTVLDNFREARSGGRSHEGTDILASLGQAVHAVADGVLTKQYVVGGANSSLSGNAWQLNASDGTGAYYFYAHLSGFREGLAVGSAVRRGDVIGYVGDTGNPGSGNHHLHFEAHPTGGAAVNPLPLLDVPASCTVY